MNYFTFAQAAKTLPGNPAPQTLWRWYRDGIRGVKLQTKLIGGRRFTTAEWLDQFNEALERKNEPEQETEERSPALTRQLQKAGVL